jgi:membrane protein
LRLPALPASVLDFGLRCLRRFVEIEGATQATVLGAQAFTSLIPFLVIASVAAPGDSDLADRIIERFGLEGASARSVEALFADSTEVESAVTWVSVVILILATLSFTRAMQRMFQRAYSVQPAGVSDVWRGFAWLAGFVAWIVISSPLRGSLKDFGGIFLAVAATTVTGFGLWLWTPTILLHTRDWRRLVPGAMVSGLLGALLGVASGIYVPIVMEWSARKYGLIGVAFSLQSWMLVFAFVIVIGAVVGAVVSERFGVITWRTLRERAR